MTADRKRNIGMTVRLVILLFPLTFDPFIVDSLNPFNRPRPCLPYQTRLWWDKSESNLFSVPPRFDVTGSNQNNDDNIGSSEMSWWDELWSDNGFEEDEHVTKHDLRRNYGEQGIEFSLPRCSQTKSEMLTRWDENEIHAICHEDAMVVLATQCSLDRLDRLKEQVQLWGGFVSVAIYISDESSGVTKWEDRIRKAFQDNGRVAVSIIYKERDDDPYPINYLRNVALLEAREQHASLISNTLQQLSVLLVDVDFVPSANLNYLLHTKDATEVLKDEIVIVPAFEAIRNDESKKLPATLEDLRKLYAVGEAHSFDAGRFSKGHTSTNFAKYWALSLSESLETTREEMGAKTYWSKRYGVHHSEGFEPYIVMLASRVPLYDERFQGYGLNKISHLASVAKIVTKTFTVLPGVFLVAASHQPSKEYRRIYGKNQSTSLDPSELKKKASLQANLRFLYWDFCQRLQAGDAVVVSDITRSRYEALNGGS